MIERETADALREAIEQLDAALRVLSGLRGTLLRSNGEIIDLAALRGALVLVHSGVQHANALLHSILDKGR